MCRLAAYLGPPLRLRRFLMEPEHSLMRQSWEPQELREAVVNADGYGVGWFNEEGKPAVYTCTRPIWADTNLDGLADSLQSRVWLANVRSATPGQPTSEANTQPFLHSGLIYLHNGYLEDFNLQMRVEFHRRLPAKLLATLQGNSDSEYLFALIRHYRENGTPLHEAIATSCRELSDVAGRKTALFNAILCDGKRLYLCRYAVNGACPSLYYLTAPERYPEGMLVASERLDADAGWQPVPERRVLVLDRGRPTSEFVL